MLQRFPNGELIKVPDNNDCSEFFKVQRIFDLSKFTIGDLYEISYVSDFNKNDPCRLYGFLLKKTPEELTFVHVEDVNCTTEGQIENCTVTPNDIDTGVVLRHCETGRIISK